MDVLRNFRNKKPNTPDEAVRMFEAAMLALETERAQQVPPNFAPDGLRGISSGISNQPKAADLLRESAGVADTATRAIANRVASLNPLVKTHRPVVVGTEEDEILDGHPLKVLLDRPHPSFSRTQLFRLTTQYLITVGDAAWVKVGSELGTTVELHPMSPTMYEPIVSSGVVVGFLVTDGNGKRSELPASDVVRFYFPDPENPYKGEGYLAPNAVMVDSQKFSGEQLRSHYENDATAPVILKPGDTAAAPSPGEWRAFLREWAQKYNSRKGEFNNLPARLPSGWDAQELKRASGAEITPLLEHWLEVQLTNFGTPSSILGRVVSGDRSSAETNQYVFDRHTITPITTLIQEAITLQLAPEFDASIFVEFAPFVSADKEFDLKRDESDMKNKVRSVNQVREARGDDPVEWGEKPIGTANEVVFDPDETFEIEPDEPNALRVRESRAPRRGDLSPGAAWKRAQASEKKFVPKFERTIRSIIEAQRKETIRRLKASTPRSRATIDDIFNDDEWLPMFKRRVTPLLRNIYDVSGSEALALVGVSAGFVFNDEVAIRLEQDAMKLATRTSKTTNRRIAKSLSKSQLAGEGLSQMVKNINSDFGIRRREAKTIARTEVLRANQDAQLEGFRQSGVVERKQWNDSMDDRVRDSHRIGGQIVGVNEPFILDDGSEALQPAAATLGPENVINCRCFITPVLDDEEDDA